VPLPESAAEFLRHVEDRVRALSPRKRIVFPEGGDPRVVRAAERLAAQRLVEPVLIARGKGGTQGGVLYVDPERSEKTPAYAKLYYERRRKRGVTEREAKAIAARPLYFAALMVAAGDADGSVGGAANSTAETVRAALHAVGTAAGVKTISSFFVLGVPNRALGAGGLFIAADCAVVVSPTPSELADIAIVAAASARTFLEQEPRIALLPASKAELTQAAQTELKKRAPKLAVETGVEALAEANAIVFPDLHAANIGYKLVEWLGGGAAFGPMLQGLAKPANDLSRACTPDDVYTVALITALQAHSAAPT
jgi:phosphate acetyltransferase